MKRSYRRRKKNKMNAKMAKELEIDTFMQHFEDLVKKREFANAGYKRSSLELHYFSLQP